MAFFEYKETPHVEAYRTGSDMPLPDWIADCVKTWEGKNGYCEYRVFFADGFSPIGFPAEQGYMGCIGSGYWLVKIVIGSLGYGYTLTVMDNEKFEALFKPIE